jgi:hypothetical protein
MKGQVQDGHDGGRWIVWVNVDHEVGDGQGCRGGGKQSRNLTPVVCAYVVAGVLGEELDVFDPVV